jgi:hypothetical protein
MSDPATPTPEELRRLEKMNELSLSMEDAFQSMASSMAKFAKNHKEISEDDLPAATALAKDLAKSYNSLAKNSLNFLDNEERLRVGSIKAKDIQKQIAEIEKQELLNKRKYELLQARGVQLSQEELRIQADSLEYTQSQRSELSKQAIEAKKIEKAAGLSSKIFEDIAKFPLLSKLIDAEKVTDSINKKAAETSNTFKAFGAGLASTFGLAFKKLGDPLILFTAQIALVKKFYDLYGGVNKLIVDQGKQLNINKEQSQVLYENAFKYASEQRNAFVTAERILEGKYKLNEALGTSIAFSEKEAITAEKLSHYYGISEEQNAHLAVLARETGQTNEDILNNVIRTTNEQKRQFGGTLSQQKILQKVSSVSGEILTKFKGNVGALTAAVQQADRLGLTLEQVDKIGESLLNFEQSIEAELKAELLTGKAINVEKARAAALSGDTVKLTEEIAKQVGNIHEFEKLNVIQRKAYAEVFGMSVGEMGDMLRKREFEAKLGADAQKSAEEQLRIAKERGITIDESVRKDLEAKSLADAQKYTFEKIQSILARIAAGPMATIYKYIEKGLKGVEGIFGFFSKMTGGTLGSALGTAIMAGPALVLAARGLIGFAKSIYLGARGTDPNPMVIRFQGAGGMGGGMSRTMGNTITSSRGMVLTKAGGPAVGGGGFMRNPMGLGLAGIGAGLLTSAITSNMEAGGGKTAVSALGGATTGALTGASVGALFGGVGAVPGAIIGGLLGGISNLISGLNEDREQRKQETETTKEAQRKANETLEALATRPLELKVNNDTIANWNTYSQQNGANGRLSS